MARQWAPAALYNQQGVARTPTMDATIKMGKKKKKESVRRMVVGLRASFDRSYLVRSSSNG